VTRRARVVLGVLIGAIAISVIAIVVSFRALEPRMHDWVTSNLSKALDSRIELGAVHVRWLPLQLHAHDLTVRHRGRTDIPPLLVVKSFIVDLKPTDLQSSTIDRVWVDGLELTIPPKDSQTGRRSLPWPDGSDTGESSGMIIRQLIASNAKLTVVPSDPEKTPKVWDVSALEMKNLRAGESATFTASINNPIPQGRIEASGKFGPWQKRDPGTSALSGEYTFDADLGTIAGLAGRLGALGTMDGSLEHISTKGQTKTSDFRLTELDGISLSLHTAYDAVVDGIEGDVALKHVDVTLGKSKFAVQGIVEGTKGLKGKRVIVKVNSDSANLGELLRFVSKAARPPAEGTLVIDAALDLPQGQQRVLERVALEGAVRAERVRFTSEAVQDKIDELSRKAQGRPEDSSIDDVASRMATKFTLRNGVFTYRGLSFNVQGATVRLDGTHSLRSKAVDLSGVVLLNATVSQTQTGFRSWLLKPFDPLFRKNGAGTRLAIKVAGTQDQPKVGLEIGRTLKGQ
jgi:hypothetical protein